MNAATVLNFFIKRKIVNLNQIQIKKLCSLIGSDVILGIKFSNAILTSNNKIKKFSNLPKYYVLLVKPNFGCSTKKYILMLKSLPNQGSIIQKNKCSVRII